MPEHTSFITYLLHLFPALGQNAHAFGSMLVSRHPVEAHHLEPSFTAALVALFVLGLAAFVRGQLRDPKQSAIPEETLTVRTFVEIFVGYFYDVAKDVMGPKKAKRYFPIVGACALFIFFSNILGLIPGMAPPTSSLSVTLGCALLVFLLFNYYGLKENGFGYVKHLFGPWLGPLGIPLNLGIFVIEVFSTCVRPISLAVRLMINMAVDHIVGSVFLGLFALLVPIPALVLGLLVVCVQTLVFCLLTAVYIGLATEHEESH
ncbi:MAG: F0F1 ATP synthase subunit A [Polyangiaceae bacterium]|nr:F0F1 ATP synthase subunit A [Polyangiaceae bacterium]